MGTRAKTVLTFLILVVSACLVWYFFREHPAAAGPSSPPSDVSGESSGASPEPASAAPAEVPGPPPRPPEPEDLREAGRSTLDVHVVDAGEKPVEGIAVTLQDDPPASASTNNAGVASFSRYPLRKVYATATEEATGVRYRTLIRPLQTMATLVLEATEVRPGIVLTDTGEPVAGASVTARCTSPTGSREQSVIGEAVTDSRGGFMIRVPEGPPDGTVEASVEGHLPGEVKLRDLAADDIIEITLDQGIAVVVEPVIDGRPYTAGPIRVRLAGGARKAPDPVRTAVLRDGSFRVSGLPVPFGGTNLERTILVTTEDGGLVGVAGLDLPPKAGGEVRVAVALHPPRDLPGRVVDGAGNPLPGLDVTYHANQVTLATRTGEDGRFLLEGLPSGMDPEAVQITRGRGVLLSEETVAGILAVPEIVIRDQHTIEGRVRGTDGRPLPGAAILGPFSHLIFRTPYEGSHEPAALSDADGRFRVAVRTERKGAFIVAAPGYVPVYVPIEDLGKEPVVLEPGRTISGRVILEGRPVAHTTVILERSGVTRGRIDCLILRRSTDPDGRVSFADLPPGIGVVLTVEDPPQGWTDPVEVPPTAAPEVTIPLAPGRTVTGRVVLEGGGAVGPGSVRISVGGPVGERTRTVALAADGSFRVSGLPPGPLRIEPCSRARSEPGRAGIRFEGTEVPFDGTEDDVGEVPVHPAPRVTGVVRTSEGGPCAGAEAWVRGTSPRDSMGNVYRAADYTQVTGDDGRFAIGVPTGGPYQVTARAPGFLPGGRRCESGQSVEIVLDPAALVEGRVLDSRERGLPDIHVVVTILDANVPRPIRHRFTDAGGGFRIEVPKGTECRIEIVSPGWKPVSVTVTAPATPTLRTSR